MAHGVSHVSHSSRAARARCSRLLILVLASTDPSSDMVLLIYGPKQLDGAGRQVVLLIFVSGKIVLTGAKEKQARTHPAPPPRSSGCLCIPAPARRGSSLRHGRRRRRPARLKGTGAATA